MATVDLEEDESGPAPRAEVRSPRRIVIMLASVGVVVLALMFGQRTIDARHRAEVAALATVPGVVAPLDEHLEVTRRISGEDVDTAFGPNGSVEHARDGSQRYVWRAQGGAPLWSTPLMGARPALAGLADMYTGTSCIPEGQQSYIGYWDLSDVRRLVCLVSDGGVSFTEDETVEVPARTVGVMVLATADGAIEHQWSLAHGEGITVVPGVAVVQWTDGNDVFVEGHDLRTGALRWTHRIRGTEVPSAGFASGNIGTAGRLVTVDGVDGRFVVLSPDGEVVIDVSPSPQRGFVERSVDAAGRIFVYGLGGKMRGATTLVAPDGNPAHNVAVDGVVVPASVDDGSAGDLFLTGSDGLEAWDGATGERRWKADVSTSSVLVLAGRIYAVTGDGVVSLDVGSGEEVWHASVEDASSYSGLFTDGQHVLVEKSDGGLGLIALDRETGEVRFRAPYPKDVRALFPVGHSLVGHVDSSGGYLVVE